MDRQSDHTSAMFDHFRSPDRQWMFYAGPSMNPTLRASDILHIVPYKHRRIRLGDVIVFMPSEGGRPIAHRAVSEDAQGVRTRGDNNTHVDPYVPEPSRIIGQVLFAQNGDKWRRVYGGTVGRVIGNLMNVRNLIYRRLSAVLDANAQGPSWLKMVGTWIMSRMQRRIVRFRARGGSELQMLVGSHLIARLPAGRDRWVIRPLFRPFIDEAGLPTGDASGDQRLTNVE
jgi:signal peptidase I